MDSNNTAGALTPLSSPEACRVVVANRASAYPLAALTFSSLHLTGNSKLTHLSGQSNLALTVQDDLVVDAGSAITVNGKGFGSATGPGAGGAGGGGGGHGGPGGSVVNGAVGGTVNDSASEPVLWGSGGGVGYASAGGTGGGAVRLIIGGTFVLNGELTADGIAGGPNGGGGAGGSIWVTANTLAGAGNVWARGSTSAYAGGGGGGRIMLAVDRRGGFSGTATASGGTGLSREAGTVQQVPRTMPVLGMTRGGGAMEFNWSGVDGLIYQLQSSQTLEAGSWHDEGEPQIGSGAPLSQSLPIGSDAIRFYRLKVSN